MGNGGKGAATHATANVDDDAAAFVRPSAAGLPHRSGTDKFRHGGCISCACLPASPALSGEPMRTSLIRPLCSAVAVALGAAACGDLASLPDSAARSGAGTYRDQA